MCSAKVRRARGAEAGAEGAPPSPVSSHLVATPPSVVIDRPVGHSLAHSQVQLPRGGMPDNQADYNKWWNSAAFAGYCLFWSGLSVGLTNLGSG